MKFTKDRYAFLSVLIAATALFLAACSNADKFKEKQINALIGNYYIDTENTVINDYDLDDVKDLRLSLKADGAFLFNKDYPFIYDSVGLWFPRKAGLDEWNWLYFNRTSEVRCQFADSWKGIPVNDSTLILNSMTPKKGKSAISVIYLKKE